jgi:endonuclease G
VTAFDPEFLSISAPLPAVPSGLTVRELPFTHFTVLLEPDRRLAVVTAVNLDGAQLLDLDRGDDWHLDPRVPAEEQTGPDVYADNDLDRGHLVRRRDPVWGDAETAAQANLDSFTYVNAAPQAALFNQGELLWAGLENYILDHARANGQRLSVFTAPVLAPDDPPYRGIQVPRRFWKVVGWATSDGTGGTPALAATGYVLDQSEVLDPLLESTAEPPPLGAYLTYQVPLVDIVALTGLDLGPLLAADRLPSPEPVPAGDLSPAAVGERWVLLHRSSDIRL